MLLLLPLLQSNRIMDGGYHYSLFLENIKCKTFLRAFFVINFDTEKFLLLVKSAISTRSGNLHVTVKIGSCHMMIGVTVACRRLRIDSIDASSEPTESVI